MVEVIITHDDDIAAAIGAALDRIDLAPLIAGKVVAVKPNETWASAEDRTAVTQPDTLGAVLRHMKRFGPSELIVSGGAGAGQTDEIFLRVGLMDAVEAEGATFFDHNRPPFVSVDLSYSPESDVDGP